MLDESFPLEDPRMMTSNYVLVNDRGEDPRNLTVQLVAQLEVVAEQSADGQIPLHGRLFQQWLHYVFP